VWTWHGWLLWFGVESISKCHKGVMRCNTLTQSYCLPLPLPFPLPLAGRALLLPAFTFAFPWPQPNHQLPLGLGSCNCNWCPNVRVHSILIWGHIFQPELMSFGQFWLGPISSELHLGFFDHTRHSGCYSAWSLRITTVQVNPLFVYLCYIP